MRSRPHVLPLRKARPRPPGDLSASGSVTSSRRRFASSYSTTSGCGTISAGQCLTAERVEAPAPPTTPSELDASQSRPRSRATSPTVPVPKNGSRTMPGRGAAANRQAGPTGPPSRLVAGPQALPRWLKARAGQVARMGRRTSSDGKWRSALRGSPGCRCAIRRPDSCHGDGRAARPPGRGADRPGCRRAVPPMPAAVPTAAEPTGRSSECGTRGWRPGQVVPGVLPQLP
jgi:hypothetical protein